MAEKTDTLKFDFVGLFSAMRDLNDKIMYICAMVNRLLHMCDV